MNFYKYFHSYMDFFNDGYKLAFIFWFNKQVFKLQSFIHYIENKKYDFGIIRKVRYILSFMNKQSIEPNHQGWSNYIIELSNNKKTNYVDYYKKLIVNNLNDDEINGIYNNTYKESLITINNDTSINNILLIMKYNDVYISRNINKLAITRIYSNSSLSNYDKQENIDGILITMPTKSHKFFITAEYFHPNMNKTITINIKPYYYSGNDILSKLFIYRYLKYQPETYIFDNDYKIIIMDETFNSIMISHDEYITLYSKKYVIKKIT